MGEHKKIKVAVLYGGRSGEHEVSLVSATNVIENLDRSRFEVVPIGVDKQGGWYLGDDVFKNGLTNSSFLRLQSSAERLVFDPQLIGKNNQALMPASSVPTELSSHSAFDVVFPVIHGVLCEDGTMQGLLESADLPYVGCGVLASAMGMDKDISKRLVQQAGIPTPAYLSIKKDQWMREPHLMCQKIIAQLSFPVFVKPANTGSSVGVHKVKSPKELESALEDAFQYDLKVVCGGR